MANELNFREKRIIKTSIIGIITNFLLTAFKLVAGLIAHSIAIVLDAVNNLSDALSSIITIIGAKIAGKEPDKEHPYGHGRAEYLSTIIIAIIILYAGITALIESVKKIITPQLPDYSTVTLVIVIVAIFVKIALGLYFKKVGKEVNSHSLIGSGKDALIDAIISFGTLVSALIFIFFNLSLEAYIGILISIFILKAGIEMIKISTSQILGERIDKDISANVKETVSSFDGVNGTYDLILHNYGPDTLMGSLHIEVEENLTANEIDKLCRQITKEVYAKHKVILTAIGIYSKNKEDDKTAEIKAKITQTLEKYNILNKMHGFYIDFNEKTITFDIIFDFSTKNRNEIYKAICEEIQNAIPDYNISITMDMDISD